MNTFFTQELAKRLRSEGKQADVFLANNVLAHVPDLNGFVEGIRTLLKDDGVAVIEAPYLVDLVDHSEFDTIYHQHLCYFSITALDNLFRRHGLYPERCEAHLAFTADRSACSSSQRKMSGPRQGAARDGGEAQGGQDATTCGISRRGSSGSAPRCRTCWKG